MNKLLLLSLFASLHLFGCAVEENNNPDWKAGIYTGYITPQGAANEPSFLLITSDQRAFFAETDVENAGLGTVSGSVLNFGGQASMTLADELADALTGTFNFGVMTGSFNLSQSSLYNTGSSPGTLQGRYVDTIDTAGIGETTWNFETGVFTFLGGFGCTGNGYIVPIDTTKNEYQVDMFITSCTGYMDGSYKGLAFTDTTTTTNDTIYLLVQNATFDALIFSKMIRR